jgi:PD-(D/E)XK nuclease superfamily
VGVAALTSSPTQQELEAAHCLEAEDRVPGRPQMTAFRQALRLHQARWREAHGHPIGSQPIVPRPGGRSRPVGSRLPLDYARKTGANFVTPAAVAAARARAALVEPHQSIDHQRMWADLLWSPSLALNLFGDLAVDLDLADRGVRAWWPDAPGRVTDVRFAHSPGRFDPHFLNSLRAFDAAFYLDRGDGRHGVIGVAVAYHERAKAEIPKPENLDRYLQVADRSQAFAPGGVASVKGRSPLAVTWLEHLLLLSMLQHPSGRWTWGRYVVVHPAGNTDIAELCAKYRALLADETTFATVTLEDLVEGGALPAQARDAIRERYLVLPPSPGE